MPDITEMKNKARDEVIGQSAVLFFLIFTIIYILPDEDFKRRAKAAVVVFTVIRVLMKFYIFIPYKEELAMKRIREQYWKYLLQYT